MAKNKRKKRGKSKKLQIFIPKCCQQPRSHGPKPRTDFSLFFSKSSYSSLLHRHQVGTMLDFSNYKDGLSSITTARMVPKFPLVQCSRSQNGGQERIFPNPVGVPVTEIELVSQNILLNNCDNRNSDSARPLVCTPNKSTSQNTESRDVWITPGSIVWAKNACQMWWPAKIMEGRSTQVSTSDQDVDAHVLVQYYGNHECAWVDPVADLSQFDDYFEERSCNPMEVFQDALKQALNRKEQLSSCRQLDRSPDELKGSNQHEQSSLALSDKWIESSSSRTGDDHQDGDGGRGKRKRKPKVHFDEVTFPIKSMKKVRRFKIMRYLGLTAPIGSPFSLTSRVRTPNKSSRVLDI